MKDYTLNMKEEKNNFILRYKKIGTDLEISFANGDVIRIPYTEDNENKLLDRMEAQVNQYLKNEKKIINKINKLIFNLIILTSTVVVLSSAYFFLYTSVINILLLKVAIGASLAFTIANGIKLSKCKSILKDLHKNKYFLVNKEKLNERVKENSNMLYNTTSKTKSLVHNTAEISPVFTINSIDPIPLEDLYAIDNNINRQDMFDFGYEEEGPVKKKTKRKK